MPGIHGMAARTSSAAHYIRLAASALSVLPATSVVSVGVWKRKTDATLRASRFISDDTNNHFILQIYSDGKLYHNYGPPSPQASVSGAWGDDRLLLVSNGSQITLDQNGRQISSSGVIGAYSNAGNTGLYLGDFNTPDAADFDDFYTVAIWRRALSTAERVEWYLNPWQLFGADPTRVYSLPAAGGIPSSLNVAASNITTTGARITATLSF